MISGFVFCSILLVGCNGEKEEASEFVLTDIEQEVVVDDQDSSSKGEVEIDTNEIDSLRMEVESLNERTQYLLTTINNLLDSLSDEEMLQFSKDQITYELSINGEPIPENGQIIVEEGMVEILLSEMKLGFDFLSEDWLEKGIISGEEYIDHLLNIDTLNWTLIGSDGTVNTSRGYQSADIKSGQQVTFEITDELRERLGIDTNLIQIKLK